MKSLTKLLEMPFSGRQKRLAADRPAMSKSEFIANSSSTELGNSAAALLWEKLESEKVFDGLSPYPDDDLLQVYGLANEDLDEDVILEIIRETGAPLPSVDALKAFGPVRTAADIVRLVEEGGGADREQKSGKS